MTAPLFDLPDDGEVEHSAATGMAVEAVPSATPDLTPTCRTAEIGDGMSLRCTTSPKRGVVLRDQEVVFTVRAVTRLGCGCDRAEGKRPNSVGPAPFDVLWLWPAGCHHDQGVDLDEAREHLRSTS